MNQLAGRRYGDDFLVGQNRNSVTNRKQAVEIVRHHQNRKIQRIAEVIDQFVKRCRADRVQPGCRFIQKDQIRVQRQRPGGVGEARREAAATG